jgi:hypothetical protein
MLLQYDFFNMKIVSSNLKEVVEYIIIFPLMQYSFCRWLQNLKTGAGKVATQVHVIIIVIIIIITILSSVRPSGSLQSHSTT